MSNKDFVWTNQKVRDFAEWYRKNQGQPTPHDWGRDLLEMWMCANQSQPQKEWEIGVIQVDNTKFYRNSNGFFFDATLSKWDVRFFKEEELLKPSVIHSVRRLSDGEVFTIGDEINAFSSMYKNRVIESFYVLGGLMMASTKDPNGYDGVRDDFKIADIEKLAKSKINNQ